MKQFSQNYINNEKGYVKDWAAYISGHDMTMGDALEFLRDINANEERFTHIVDMDSYEAYSSYYSPGEEKTDTYLKYKDVKTPKPTGEADVPFGDIMENMFKGTDEEFAILGKYRLQETQSMAVAVGTRVSLCSGSEKKDYLLLRIIPVDVLKRSWVFPMEYATGEIGIITTSGDYVIQSASMKFQNFLEYIRGYNFQDDYNKVNELRNRLENTESGVLRYKNFRETDCLWYYSSFGSGSALDILGEKSVYAYREPWFGFSANTNGDHYEYAVEFLRFLATEDEINKMGTIKGIPSVAVKKTENPVYQYVLNPKDPQMEYVNDGTITPKIMSGWCECTSQYGVGEFVSGREALEYFISSCKQ